MRMFLSEAPWASQNTVVYVQPSPYPTLPVIPGACNLSMSRANSFKETTTVVAAENFAAIEAIVRRPLFSFHFLLVWGFSDTAHYYAW